MKIKITVYIGQINARYTKIVEYDDDEFFDDDGIEKEIIEKALNSMVEISWERVSE